MPHEAARALRALSRAQTQLDVLTAELHGRAPTDSVISDALLRARHRGLQLSAVLGDSVFCAAPLSLVQAARAAADAGCVSLQVAVAPCGPEADRLLSERERVAVACLVTGAISNEARHGKSDRVVMHVGALRNGGATGLRVQSADAPMTAEMLPWDHPAAPVQAGFGLRAAAGRARSAGGSLLVGAAGDRVAVELELGPQQEATEAAHEVLEVRVGAALTLLQAHGAASILTELRPLLPRADAQALSAVMSAIHAAADVCLRATQPPRLSR